MKSFYKKFAMAILSFLLIFSFTLTASAASANNNNDSNPSWFQDVSVKDISNDKKAEIIKDVKSKKTSTYYLIHNEGDELLPEQIKDLMIGEWEYANDPLGTPNYLLGIGIENDNGVIRTDFHFDQVDHIPLGQLKDTVSRKAFERKISISTDVSAMSTPTYGDSYSQTFRNANDNNVIVGYYTSNVDYYRQGTSIINGKTTSVWDIKYFNQVRPNYSSTLYQTRNVITRSSVEAYVNQTVRSYGPTTTSAGAGAAVSLTGIMPTFSWAFGNTGVTITDSSVLPKYGRWTFDFPLGTTYSKNSYAAEPGTRITNTVGNIGIQHSHSIYWYKNLSYSITSYTGILERFWPDL